MKFTSFILTFLFVLGFSATDLRAENPPWLSTYKDLDSFGNEIAPAARATDLKTINELLIRWVSLEEDALKVLERSGEALEALTKELGKASQISVAGAPARPGLEINPQVTSTLRTLVLDGKPQPAENALSICFISVRINEIMFQVAHARALTLGMNRMHRAEYNEITEGLRQDLATIRSLFPAFPKLATERNENETLSAADHFNLLSFFAREPVLLLPSEVTKLAHEKAGEFNVLKQKTFATIDAGTGARVTDYLVAIDRIFTNVNGYVKHFPAAVFGNTLARLADNFHGTPGFTACLLLAQNVANFVGEPCHPQEFIKRLDEFIKYYEAKRGNGAAGFIVSEIADFYGEQKMAGAKDISDVSPAAWDSLAKRLVRNLAIARGVGPLAGNQTLANQLTDSLITGLKKRPIDDKGLLIAGDVTKILNDHGVSTDGFDRDYFLEALEAKKLLGGFTDKINGFAQRSKTPVPESLVYVDPYFESCTDPKTKNHWVLNSIIEEGRATNGSNSAVGLSRVDWFYRVEMATIEALQNDSEAHTKAFFQATSRTAALFGSSIRNIFDREKSQRSWDRMWSEINRARDNTSGLNRKLLLGSEADALVRRLMTSIAQVNFLMGKSTVLSFSELGLSTPTSSLIETSQKFYRNFHPARLLATVTSVMENMVKTYGREHGTEEENMTPGASAKLTSDFRNSHRLRMLEAAQRMQELERRKDVMYAAEKAPPLVTALWDIPKDAQAFGNHTGTNLSFLREFFPTIMMEYIIRHHRETTISMHGRREINWPEMRKQYKATVETFDVDQLVEQLNYYQTGGRSAGEMGGPPILPGRISGQAVAPAEFMREIYNHPQVQARMMGHFKANHSLDYEYVEYYVRSELKNFPMLKNIWRTYRDDYYEWALKKYQTALLSEANHINSLEYDDALDYIGSNLFALELVMREHPELKSALCELQLEAKIARDTTDKRLFNAAAISTALALIPPLAEVGMVIQGGVALVEIDRSINRWREVARAERLAEALAPQLDNSFEESSAYYIRETQEQFAKQLFFTSLTVLSIGGSGAKNVAGGKSLKEVLPRVVGFPRWAKQTGINSFRAYKQGLKTAAEEQALAPWRIQPGYWVSKPLVAIGPKVRFIQRHQRAALEVLKQGGILEENTVMSSLRALDAAVKRGERVSNFSVAKILFHGAFNSIPPFAPILIGGQFGKTAGKFFLGLLGYQTYEMVHGFIKHTVDSADENLMIALNQSKEHPELFEEYRRAYYSKEIGEDVFYECIRIENGELAGLRDEVYQTLAKQFKESSGMARDTVLKKYELETKNLVAWRAAEESKSEVDLAKIRFLRKSQRDLEQQLKNLTLRY